MNKKSVRPYVLWILLCEAVGGLSAFLSRKGMEIYKQSAMKPPLTPPPLVFGIVWTILYALMGISAAHVSLTTPSFHRNTGLNLFVTQLIFNFFWSLIFFQEGAYGFALVWLIVLWILVFSMMFYFSQVDHIAVFLQVPYLLWLSFAAYLNYGVWKLN